MRKAGAARREVRCAVGLPNVGPTGDPRLLAALAAEAEAAGWDGFFVWDHVLYREPGAGGRTGRRAGDPGTAVFVRRMAPAGPGVLRLAVKDVVDVAGVPTTAGSRLLAETEGPAEADAACLAGARAAGAAVVGKTNLVELAFGASGINPWFGTPPNPLDPSLVPGGSSSGSAVAVATGEADVAYGTDTAGSIRVPSACCGTAGLKTTSGRLPLSGVRPLSPSLDTVGPMARDVAGLVAGMALLEPGFRLRAPAPAAVGRLRLPGVDPAVDRAADGALARAGIVVVEAEDPGWGEAWRAAELLLVAEAGRLNAHLLARQERLDPVVAARIERGAGIPAAEVETARRAQRRWAEVLEESVAGVGLLALPTMAAFPPPLEAANAVHYTACTLPVNLAGLPALALPVPSGRRLPASLQLVAPRWGEEALLAAGLAVEAGLGSSR